MPRLEHYNARYLSRLVSSRPFGVCVSAVCGLHFTDFRQVAFFMQTKISIRMNSPDKATEQSRDLSVC